MRQSLIFSAKDWPKQAQESAYRDTFLQSLESALESSTLCKQHWRYAIALLPMDRQISAPQTHSEKRLLTEWQHARNHNHGGGIVARWGLSDEGRRGLSSRVSRTPFRHFIHAISDQY